jgi:mRNA interferase YafQ
VLDIAVHKTFSKDLKKAQLNPTNTAKLLLFISLILNEEELPAEALDHQLSGKFQDVREFHVSGDLLVIYRLEATALELLRIGTHSQLFKGTFCSTSSVSSMSTNHWIK